MADHGCQWVVALVIGVMLPLVERLCHVGLAKIERHTVHVHDDVYDSFIPPLHTVNARRRRRRGRPSSAGHPGLSDDTVGE